MIAFGTRTPEEVEELKKGAEGDRGMAKLLDTSVVIELFGGNRKVLEELYKEGDKEYYLPVIALFELQCGHLKEREELMLEMMPYVDFDRNSAKVAGAIFRDMKKKGKRLPLKDLLIASTAIAILKCSKNTG